MSFKDVTLNNLQRQFGYTNISDLLMKKAEVWDKHYGDISETFNNEILNVDTCIPDALDYFWGRLYKITRNFTDNLGNLLTLTDDEFREIIKIRQFGSRWNGAIASMNEFLNNLYKDRGKAYMIDKQDMTVEIFVFEFPLSDTELFLFRNKDILPRPAGVGIDIFETGKGKWFGFYDYTTTIQNPTTIGFGTYSDENVGQFAQYNSNI
ncbi:MAG: DUF2612 domain-containing protein [Oscillospiraceae bacterium]|nr:DUF2612 domain-containing protein [Oscillospiraceae bacterium]